MNKYATSTEALNWIREYFKDKYMTEDNEKSEFDIYVWENGIYTYKLSVLSIIYKK